MFNFENYLYVVFMELMDKIWLAIIAVFAFLVTFFITWFLSKFFLKKGIFGHDVHKADTPKVAEMGGVGLVIVMFIVSFCCIFIFREDYWQHFTVATLVILIVGLIGIWDDLKALGAISKPFLLLIPAIPILIWQTVENPTLLDSGLLLFDPGPYLPFIGQVRITIIYWILVPFAITVLSNATNMLDVMNGSTPITVLPVAAVGIIATTLFYFKGLVTFPGLIMSILLFSSLLAFFWFNKYPAKIFCGDTGSLTIGAVVALIAIFGRIEIIIIVAMMPIAIFGRIEIIIIVAMMPHIMNSFQIINSVKGFRERREIKERPTMVIKHKKDGKLESVEIAANPNEEAPLTYTRWLVAKQPLKEQEIVASMGVVSLVSFILALITMGLIFITI